MTRRDSTRKGLFVMVDGMDGVGKGEVERAIIQYEQRLGRASFDTISFSRANRKGLPELGDFWSPPDTYFDTVVTAEPTYTGIGHSIRSEIIEKNGRNYSAMEQIQAYSLDRKIQMQRVVIPAIENGLNVLQARGCASTLCYQSLVAEDEGKDPEGIRKVILEQGGNILQLDNAPDILIIPLIEDEQELMRRLKERGKTKKEDNAIFEKVQFQMRLNPLYRSDWLREIFEGVGSQVRYLNAGISEGETRRQAIEIYRGFLEGIRQNA